MKSREERPKAAIITWCYDNGKTNYGQILQCYAMQTVLQRLGYQTKVVRYRKRDADESLSLERKPELFIDLYELWYRLIKIEKCFDGRIAAFLSFIKKNIFLSEQCYTKEQVERECEDCEILICGSDQIWNPAWFQDIYALNFGRDSQKRIAYAPSGVFIENAVNEKIYKELGGYLDRFDLVTVREKQSVAVLKKYTKKEITDVLDPTLLLTKEDWNCVAAGRIKGGPYIFCYSMGRLREHKLLLKRIMKKYRVRKIFFIVSGLYEGENELEKEGYFYPVKNAGPAQFLALIRDARAVCTDSFHGLALSIVYQKSFFVLERNYPQEYASFARQENLLKKTGIGKGRFVRCVRDLEKVEEIDYEKIRLGEYWDEIRTMLISVI